MTTEQIIQVKKLNESGMPDTDIARLLGVSRWTISRVREQLGLPTVKRKGRPTRKKYTVWLKETGEMIAQGSAVEVAKKLNYSVTSIRVGMSRKFHVTEEWT